MTLLKAALLTGSSKKDRPRRETLRSQRVRGLKPSKDKFANHLLVLASGSPRRFSLLAQIGIEPTAIRPVSINETPKPFELPRSLAQRLARAKAKATIHQIMNDNELAHAYVLAADTVVSIGRRVLSKPTHIEDALACLELLSGRSHRVTTNICLITPDDRIRTRSIETRVQFRILSTKDVETYIATREWYGKAGGYAIQGVAGCFVQKLIGSYTNVVGLPLTETAALLKGEGLPIHYGWLDAADVEL